MITRDYLPSISSLEYTILPQRTKVWEDNPTNNELKLALQNYPANGNFAQRFSKGGEYYDLIKKQLPLFEDAVKESIIDKIRELISNMGFDGEYSLGDVNHFLETLDKEIESYIQKCPQSQPQFDFNAINFSAMKFAEENYWTTVIFLRESAIKQQRERIFDQFKTLVNDTYKELRNFLLKDALTNLRRELGVGIKREKEVFDSSRTIQQMLNQMISKVKNCAKTFKNDHDTLVQEIKQLNVRILCRNKNNDIEQDARSVKASIDNLKETEKSVMYDSILRRDENPITLFLLLDGEEEKIYMRLKRVLQRNALELIRSFDLIETARQRLGNELVELAKRANPYQTFNERYTPVTLGKLPNLICGQNKDHVLEELRNDLNEHKEKFVRISESPLEHLLFFYKEEAAFALDDLYAYKMLDTRYRENPGKYGHNTHRDPGIINFETLKRKTNINRWVRAAKELLKNEMFQQSPEKGLVFQYKNQMGLYRRIPVENQQEVDELALDANYDGYTAFIRSAKQEFQKLGYDKVVERINTTGRYDEYTDYYDKLLADLFPEEFARRESEKDQEEVLAQQEEITATIDTERTPADTESPEDFAQQGSTEAQQEQVEEPPKSSAQPSAAGDETQEVAAQHVQEETQQAPVASASTPGDETQEIVQKAEAPDKEEEDSHQQVQREVHREPTKK